MTKLPNDYNPLLDAIGAALGVPVEIFFTTPSEAEGANRLDLLRAWGAIGNAQGQRRVLSLARHEAAKFTRNSAIPHPPSSPSSPSES